MSVIDSENPYHSVGIRGTAELMPDPEKRLSFELSHKYLGVDPPTDRDESSATSCASSPNA